MIRRDRRCCACALRWPVALVLAWLVAGHLLADESAPLDPAGDAPAIEALERQLELGRHARLARIKSAPDSRLADFTTDGCSGGLSAGWESLAAWLAEFRAVHGDRPPWEACCIAHDRLYHAGGPRDATPDDSFEARRSADLALRDCVIETGARRAQALSAQYHLTENQIAGIYAAVADLMYRSVRLGGIPCSDLPWRWGYGWPACD